MKMNDLFGIPKTAIDVFRMLPEGTLCDVINNVLYMAEPRTYIHQYVVQKIGCALLSYVETLKSGEVIFVPLDVYLEDFLSAVQPVVLYFSNENRTILKDDGYLHGAPDLLVEVLSKDEKREKVYKKNLYERSGVKEYFIVNPINRMVSAYALNNSVYQLTYEEEGRFASSLLDFTFRF